ncbi:protein-disulfide reductase DsbD [Methylobacterium sp. NEAU K]|uniref:protein-disulfide reductase DsbD n=1 Tax=Methylobacterium sp. NEAU K TaxID=3064946 RepID=UPI0027344F0E|nr:protein-disulfide reductase DsbD [Methylobacterium sp. NEAU K]MDP4002707.1 protein-disulfide reductase DsbD [Methylobacterium sp. NEAU K]
MPNRVALIALAALVCAASYWIPGQCQEGSAPQTPFTLAATRDADLSLRLRWTIAPGTYLYRDKIGVAAGTGLLPVSTASGEIEDDPNFGPTEIYHGSAEAIVPGAALASVHEVQVTFQGCAEKGICYPHVTHHVDLSDLAITDAAPSGQGRAAASPTGSRGLQMPDAVPVGVLTQGPASLLTGNLFGLLSGMFGFGVLLAFTPCVLPMVPILSGMLVRSGRELSSKRGFVLSGSYVLAMAAAYASLGLAAAWLGRNLQVALQTPVALGLMAGAFAVLALSMFGLFDLQAPRWWRNCAGGAPAAGGGSIPGAALLGFSSALVVGPCVTPPLAAALLYVGQTGDILRGALALFALGLGMGAPLVVVGTFGAGILPRSGPWLVRMKQAFGFVFLALAVSLVTRLLPDALALLLWGALAIGFGLSVAAMATNGPAARIGKTVGIVAIAYGCVLAVGAAAGGTDPLRPLRGFGQEQAGHIAGTRVVSSVPAFEAALQAAQAEGKPVLVEFAADWCTVCRTNERTVLADAAIRERLKAVTVIRVDLTRDDADARALMQRFTVVGPPTLILMRPDGSEIRQARTEGELSVDDLTRRLALVGA